MSEQKTPVLTYTTKYVEAAAEVFEIGLENGYAVKAEPFEDVITVRWWK